MNRGIIAAPGIIHRLQDGFKMERSLSLDEMRYYVLYWDKIVIPGNNLVYIALPQEEAFLEVGAIERPRIEFGGSYQGDEITNAILSCQSLVAKELMKDKETDWVIQQFSDECILLDKYIKEKNTLRVDLASCLPVPTGKINIHDILKFKEQRKDEFIALHEYLDSFYEQALRSPDQDLSSKKAISNLARSIENLDRVTKERFEKSKKYDLSTELNLRGRDIFLGASAGALLDQLSNGLTFPLATIAGTIISTINLSAKSTLTFQPAEKNLKLAYLSSGQKYGLYK